MQPVRGFTLLELLLVLVIAGLIAGLSLVSVRALLAYSERKTLADRFAAVVKAAPKQAQQRLCWTRLDIDTAKGLLSVSACGQALDQLVLGDDMRVVWEPVPTLPAAASPPPPMPMSFWFSPKGNTPGVVLTLQSGDQVLRVVDVRPFAQ